jgi:hypothetical protein
VAIGVALEEVIKETSRVVLGWLPGLQGGLPRSLPGLLLGRLLKAPSVAVRVATSMNIRVPSMVVARVG